MRIKACHPERSEGPWFLFAAQLSLAFHTILGVNSKRLWLIPLARQVIPFRICRRDQSEPFSASPGLNMLLTFDRVSHVLKALEVDQPGHVVLCREADSQFQLVLPNAAANAVRHAGVESFGSIGHDVDEVASLFTHPTNHSNRHPERSEGPWFLPSAQISAGASKHQGPSLRSGRQT